MESKSLIAESLLNDNHEVTKIELENRINKLREEINELINNSFIRLLNKNDAVQRIKDIEYALNESEDLSPLIELIGTKATKEELKNHFESVFHLTSNDRKALDVLLNFIAEGFADWNANPEDPNYIKNKPKALPANGGNADTVNGYTAKELKNHQAYDLIIGIGLLCDNVDQLLPPDGSKNNDVAEVISKMDGRFSHSFMFRSGLYKFDLFNLKSHSINGAPNYATIFNVKSMKLNSTTIRDIKFTDSNIHIYTKVSLSDCYFDSCNIYIDASYQSTIRNCIFNNCNIQFDGMCMYNMITENRFISSGRPMYYGGNNLIINNLVY